MQTKVAKKIVALVMLTALMFSNAAFGVYAEELDEEEEKQEGDWPSDYEYEDVEKAVNTLVNGAGNGDDRYESIMDIPSDLYLYCCGKIDTVTNESVSKAFNTCREDYWESILSEVSDKNE